RMSLGLRRHPGVVVILAGLFVGALADGLMRETPWGLNATALAGALLGGVLLLQRALGIRRQPYGMGAVVAGIAAASFLGRDALVLGALDAIALLAALGFLASARDGLAPAPSLVGDAVRIVGSLFHALLGPPLLLFHDVEWTEIRPGRLVRGGVVLFRG